MGKQVENPLHRPQFTVVIPVHNAGSQLVKCIKALRASTYVDFELLVVDDCSTDDTAEVIRMCGTACLRTPSQLGPAGARNLAARQARGRILVFVDADVQVPPDALQIFAEDFARDPLLAAVFGSYDRAPAEPDFFSQYKNLMHHYVHQNSNAMAATFWAGCGAMRRDLFQEFGGFDAEKYNRPAIEDIDLGLRLTRAGYKVLLEKRVQVRHLKRWTFVGMLKSDIRDRAIPWSKLILETREMPRDLNLTYGARLSAVCTLLLMVQTVCLLEFSRLGKSFSRFVLIGTLINVSALIVINLDVYLFFRKQRGMVFTLATVLTHWLYYLYSGLVWIYCCVTHYLGTVLRPPSTVRVKPLLDFQAEASPKDAVAQPDRSDVYMQIR
jgi:glycosyltransferase involved in cell wall biosynthesis